MGHTVEEEAEQEQVVQQEKMAVVDFAKSLCEH